MTEKGTPPLPDPLPRPSGGEGENVAGAKRVPDVNRRKYGSYKTVHWQALIEFSSILSRKVRASSPRLLRDQTSRRVNAPTAVGGDGGAP